MTKLEFKEIPRAITIAKDFIKKWEGLSLTRYKCSAGVTTIGYGHVIRKNEIVGRTISEARADSLLVEDLYKAYSVLNRYCSQLDLNDYQKAALLSFIFNCGSGAFQSSTLRQKLQRGEYGLVADEFLRWVHAGGKRINGLVNRRKAESELFMKGDVQAYQANTTNLHPEKYNVRRSNPAKTFLDHHAKQVLLAMTIFIKKLKII